MGTFFRSWDLLGRSFAILKSDKELLWLPAMSALYCLAATLIICSAAAIVVVLPAMPLHDVAQRKALGQQLLPFVFLFYVVTYGVGIYFNVALVSIASDRLAGGHAALNVGLQMAWKRKWSILATTIVVLTLSTISALRAVPLYVATGRIAINRETPVNLGFKEPEASAEEDFDSTVTLETQVRILQSRILAAEVVKSMRAQNNPLFDPGGNANAMGAKPFDLNSPKDAALAARVQGSLGVKVLPGTRVIEIQCTDPNPRLAADMVNQTIATYIEQNYKTKYEATMQTSDWLAHELTDLKLKMETSQAELIRYQM